MENPAQPGVYKCVWQWQTYPPQTFYNYFNGSVWFWGDDDEVRAASTLNGVVDDENERLISWEAVQ
jgi:hypothetical protein